MASVQLLVPLTLGLVIVIGVGFAVWTRNLGLALVMLGMGALLASYKFRLHRPLKPELTHAEGGDVPVLLARDDYYWQPTGILLILVGMALLGAGFYVTFW